MNYYHELLESYSKLKKRSLNLIKEQEEKSTEDAAPDRAGLESVLKVMEAGTTKRFALQGAPKGNPIVNLKAGLLQDNGSFKINAKFGAVKSGTGTGRFNKIATKTGTTTAFEEEILALYEKWYAQGSEAQGEAISAEATKANAIEANKVALTPFLGELGLGTEQVEGQEGQEGKKEEDETSEFNPDTLKEVFRKDASFKRSIESVIQKWIEDTTIPLKDKIESAKNLRDMVYLTANLSRKVDNNFRGKDNQLEQADINKLKALLKNIAITEFGEHGKGFILNKDKVGFDEYSVLVFGRGAGKHVSRVSPWKDVVISTIEKVRDKWNDDTQSEDRIDDFEVIKPEATVTPNSRGLADEAVMAGAGDIVSIFSLSDQIKITEDDVERERLEERKSWAISRLQNHWNKATTKLSAQQLAEALRMGLESKEGTGVDTLGSMGDEELTNALVDRLVNSYPDSFCSIKLPDGKCDREEAIAFVNALASEPNGKRAFLTFLLLRANAIRDVLGKEVVPSFSYTIGDIAQTTKGKRIKKDVVYAVDSKNLEALKTHLRSKGVGITELFQTRTIGNLLDGEEMSVEDFPPGTFAGEKPTPEELKQEFTMLQVSLKTQPASNSIAKGSISPTTLMENMDDTHRTTVRSQLTKSKDNQHGVIGEEGNNEGLPTNEEINIFYGSILGATMKERGADLKKRMKKFSTENPSLFRAIALELFTLAGTAATPQLNVTNELDTGETSMESDKVFRERIQQGIGEGTLTFKYGHKNTMGAINIVDENGMTIAYLKFASGGRVEALTTPEYTRQQKENEKNKTGVAENKDSLMTDFLKAQATLIQELLATH